MPDLATSELPSPPRPLSPKARRRSWAEPRVRFWWLAAVVFFGVMLFFAITQYLEWSTERRLIQNGAVVHARIDTAGGIDLPGKSLPPDSLVDLSFTYNGQRYQVSGYLAGQKQMIVTGREIEIHVDPQDPTRWTSAAEPKNLAPQMLSSILLVPVVLLAALATWFARLPVLRAWRDGEARDASVVDTHQTSLAPLSRAVACVLTDGSDKRVITVYVPQRAARLAKGEAITLVFPPGNPGRALAAVAYQ